MEPEANTTTELTYQIALKSYEILYGRIEAHNGKIQSLMGTSCTLTFASIIAGKALDLKMGSLWYSLILFVFIATIVVSLKALLWVKKGDIIALDPGIVSDKYSKFPRDKFQAAISRYAGAHFDHNTKVLESKWRLSGCIGGLILVEASLVLVWISVFG